MPRRHARAEAPTTSRRRYSILKKCLLSASVIVLALGLCEMGLRVAIWLRSDGAAPLLGRVVSNDEFERPDPILNHVLQAGCSFIATGSPPGLEYCVSGSISSQGLNDEEIPLVKPPNEKRVLILGDSFVEARQVPRRDNFCSLLERRLSEAAGGPVRVINAGVSSYSQILEYLFYKNQLAQYGADLVIMVFFANDVFDNLRYAKDAVTDEDGVMVAVPPLAAVPWFNFQRSGVQMEDQQRWEYEDQLRFANVTTMPWPASHSYLGSILVTQYRSYSLHRRFPQPPKNDEFFILEDNPELAFFQNMGWDLTYQYIKLLRDECAGNGAQLMITTAPIASQVYGQTSYDHFFFNGKCTQADQRELQKISTNLGLKFADTLTPLKQAGTGLYYPRDGHWTKKGHQVVADALFPQVRDLLLPKN